MSYESDMMFHRRFTNDWDNPNTGKQAENTAFELETGRIRIKRMAARLQELGCEIRTKDDKIKDLEHTMHVRSVYAVALAKANHVAKNLLHNKITAYQTRRKTTPGQKVRAKRIIEVIMKKLEQA